MSDLYENVKVIVSNKVIYNPTFLDLLKQKIYDWVFNQPWNVRKVYNPRTGTTKYEYKRWFMHPWKWTIMKPAFTRQQITIIKENGDKSYYIADFKRVFDDESASEKSW